MERFVRAEQLPSAAEQQDEAILAAVNEWLAGIMPEDTLVSFISQLDFISSKAGYDDVFTDIPGSFDTVIRLHSEHLLTDELYDKIATAIDARSSLE